jgi:PAS domain S-box-containing protein
MKPDSIRILFVEDIEVDMELAIRELQRENFSIVWVRVETREDFLFQLENFKPDIIVSDYSMPTFDGLQALKLTLSKAPEIPVILFTGSINEETAVACIKAGAIDYVLKDKMKRLPFAIKEALIQKEIRLSNARAQLDLQQSEERYRTFMNSSDDMAFLKDESFKYILVNLANQLFFQKPESGIIGKTDFDLMPEEAAQSCRNSDLEALKQNSIVISVERIGGKVYESRKFPVQLKKGKVGVGGFIRDISEKEQAENLLRLQGTALNSAANAIVITDTQGHIHFVNPAFTKLTGYSPEECIGKNPKELVKSGIHNAEFYHEMWGTLLKGEVWHGEFINRSKEGKFYNEENTITPVQNEKGEITHFVAIKQDITERKVAEIKIEASERKYRQLVNNAIIGIYSATIEGTFLQVNEPLCKILESESEEELMAVPIHKIYKYPEHRQKLIEQLMAKGRILNHEVELVTMKGNHRNVVINAILEGNQLIGMVLDMTERKKSEHELLKAKEKAEESDKLKTSFLANMSHEVRTPMNAILGYTDLLLSPDYPESEKTEYVRIISKSSQQLLKIMNDIVEISRIATNQIDDNPVSFNINTLLRELVLEFQPLARFKKLKFTCNTGLNDEAAMIRFDDMKLRQILGNLIDNAIKFSEKGQVEIGYKLKDSIVEFYVKDTGIGILPENQEIIFDRFRQLEDSYTRKYGGSGLGLAIAKAFIEFLGGKIWVKSTPGKGSTFFFNLPYIPHEVKFKPKFEPASSDEDFSHLTILIAEDDDINYVYMERLLSKTNAKLIRAANGQEAVDYYTHSTNIDIILMDINMPFMNGLDATKIIKALNPELPIIAVTAYSLSGDRETCLAAGCDDYIPKPIKREELFSKLHQYLD